MKTKLAAIMVGGSLAVAGLAVSQFSTAGASARTAPESARVATLDVFAIVDRVLMNEENQQAMMGLQNRVNEELNEIDERVRGLQAQLNELPEESPERFQIIQEGQMILQQREELYNSAVEQLDAQRAELAADAYEQIHKAANELANNNGYTHVIATRGGPENIDRRAINAVVQEITLRPMLAFPKSDDITERVMKQLGIDPDAEVETEMMEMAPPFGG
ncbi:MAG: OmpH family outer membrane protein [Phycisphaerales bacterium]|nr:OmpH family outer membrane protein [Phycisphaerales bacterium]